MFKKYKHVHNFSKEDNVRLYIDPKFNICRDFYSLTRLLESNDKPFFISNHLNQKEKIFSINEFFTRNESSYREYLENCKYL